MNKLSQTLLRMPDWLKGATLGVIVYIIPLVLLQVFGTSLSWRGWEKWFGTLLIAVVHPWSMWAVAISLLLGVDIFYELTDVFEELGIMTIFEYTFTPLVWASLGALFSKIWGFRRGWKALLVFGVIVIGISILFTLIVFAFIGSD